ncbi:ATP-binding protein [Agromyces fucosus]|uniref:ATP-binding protein n=1 Tax=Agromyces fucosus TaxID=41985 RepID=A0A4Q2JPM2_9MICO|nr:ATP-binding protein [Agromyces fucosus]
MHMAYVPRLADGELTAALARAGAVLIEGPKACGKTETALQQSASVVHVDTDPSVDQLMAVDPALLLEGDTPRLFDEWQLQPRLWNAVRREVDSRGSRGQFILTGSTAPSRDASRHSGAGRFARLQMHTMTLFESGHSNGNVSFGALLEGAAPRAVDPGLTFDALITRIAVGGWPGFVGSSATDVLAGLRDYVSFVAEVDIQTAGTARDPRRVRRLMTSLARATATEISISTLARDEASLSRDAVREYLDALARIFVVEDQPAWSQHLRSSATLRKEPKRHFCDPSLAVALLGADATALRKDLAFLGQLFESLVVHELRAFSQATGADVFHARDSTGREVDAIVQRRDGRWAAFEVKLGNSPETIEAAANSLLRFAGDVDTRTDALAPTLGVIVGSGPSYRRPDGVDVIAIGAFGP